MCLGCLTATAACPFVCLASMVQRLYGCCRGKGKIRSYGETFPHNGATAADFRSEWTPMEGLTVPDQQRLYESRAFPPTARLREFPIPYFLGRRCMQLFAEARFADNG